jgi:hypothetical protein
VKEAAVTLAASFRIFLSLLTIQPTFAQAAAATPQRSTSGMQKTYVVDFSWSQVQRLSPGAEIMVRKAGVALPRQNVLAVSDDEVKTFAVSDLAVEFAKQLRKAAVTHPEYLLEPQPAGTRIPLGGRVSLKDSGVFVGERRVAELQQFIVTISRGEVESGSATLSMPPVQDRLSGPAKVLIGIGITVAACIAYMAILIQGMD